MDDFMDDLTDRILDALTDPYLETGRAKKLVFAIDRACVGRARAEIILALCFTLHRVLNDLGDRPPGTREAMLSAFIRLIDVAEGSA